MIKSHGQARSLAVSAWPLRFKVALAIAIPLLLAATLGLLQVRSDLTEAANSTSSARQVTVLRPAVAYLTAAERAMVAAQDPSDASAAELDAAVKDLQAAGDDLAAARNNPDLTPEQRYQIDAMLDLSRAMREASTDTLSPGTWIAQARQLQSGVTQLITTIVNAQINPEPRLEQLSQTLGGRFSLAMQQALVSTERTGDTGSLELFAELGVESAAIDRLASTIGDSEPAVADLRTENAERTRVVRTGGDDLGGTEAYKNYDTLTGDLTTGIDQQLATNADDARRSALISGGIVFGALLAALLLAFLVSRLLLKPLTKVREGARNVANEQLPEAVARIRAGNDPGPIRPIDVTTHEEVGQLARAVDELHRQAVTLASGEAALRSQVSEMFITLSRRNTSLINQQLALIERLETDEEDPRRLESLFLLDHLAARMRRTADSLLVLADVPTSTTAEDELTVASSLQAATAGVQDYKRVHVGTASTAQIRDRAAADVVHLLTELVDNALAYSAPTTTVLISSTSAPGGVTVEIEDSGLGIPEQALADINETLRNGADVTPDTARRMGLFVVSRLAQRHGITVSLKRNHDGGTTAVVLLPASILDVPAPKPVAPPVPMTMPPPPPPQRVPTSVPTELPSLEQRLTAATSLPQRQPGAQTPSTSPAPQAAPVGDGAPASIPTPVASSGTDTDARPTVAVPTSSVPRPQPAVAPPNGVAPPQGVAAPTPLLQVAPPVAEAVTPEPAPEAPSAAAPATAPATASDHLGPLQAFAPMEDSEAEAETPIFKALRSAWLSADATEETWRSSEVEAGWARADRVADSLVEAPLNPSGLPVRRPGTRLVPGGVSKPNTVAARDPEAIRARLAAHAAGVSRGRAAATTVPDQPPSEEGPA